MTIQERDTNPSATPSTLNVPNGYFAVSGSTGFLNYGMEYIDEVNLAFTGTVTFSNIPDRFRHLRVVVKRARASDAQTSNTVVMRVGKGTVDSGNNYSYMVLWAGSAGSNQSSAGDSSAKGFIIPAANATADIYGNGTFEIFDYSTAGFYRNGTVQGGQTDVANNYRMANGVFTWRNKINPIDTVQLLPSAASFVTGTSVQLYGIY
jgi:hypothetical protein